MSPSLDALDRIVGRVVPADFKRFIEARHGTQPLFDGFAGPQDVGESRICEYYDLSALALDEEDAAYLFFARDPFGDRIGLDVRDWSIVYWDHERDSISTLAADINSFALMLEARDPEGDPQMLAVRSGASMDDLILACGSMKKLLQYRFDGRYTATEAAAMASNPSLLEELLKNGFEVGDSLAIAARNNAIQCVRVLLRFGVDVWCEFRGEDIIAVPKRLGYSEVVGMIEAKRS